MHLKAQCRQCRHRGPTRTTSSSHRKGISQKGSRGEQSASRTELNKRVSFPFACLAFALIAVPLGVSAHRRETSMGFLIGIVVAFAYFLFVIAADTLRSNPSAHPELLVWLPNVLFLMIGAWMFRRLARQ